MRVSALCHGRWCPQWAVAILSLTSGITKVLKSFQTTWTSYKIVILICHCLKFAWFCLTTQSYCEVLATAHLKTNKERAGGYKPLKHRPAYKIQDFTAIKVETVIDQLGENKWCIALFKHESMLLQCVTVLGSWFAPQDSSCFPVWKSTIKNVCVLQCLLKVLYIFEDKETQRDHVKNQ